MKRRLHLPLVFARLASIAAPATGQVVKAGDVARDFTVIDRATGRPLRLRDFAGQAVSLYSPNNLSASFFTHECIKPSS